MIGQDDRDSYKILMFQSNSPISCWPELSFRFEVVCYTIQKLKARSLRSIHVKHLVIERWALSDEIADLNSNALIVKWTASKFEAATIK